MARRPRLFAPGLLYHVIARGNQRQRVFLSVADYHAYLTRLIRYRLEHEVRVYAYCLMPNHVHFVVQVGETPLAKFMQGVQQSYTQRFNRVHAQVGHLFQGRYKAIVCDRESYLAALVRYVHLNPVRAGLVERPDAYAYSSHLAYLRGRVTDLIDPRPVLALLGGPAAYESFVKAGMSESDQDSQYRFGEERRPGPEERAASAEHRPDDATVARRVPAERMLALIAQGLGVDPGLLKSPDRGQEACRVRGLVAYAMVRRVGCPVGEVAAYLGRDIATVSQLVSRVGRRLPADAATRQDVARLNELLLSRIESLTPTYGRPG